MCRLRIEQNQLVDLKRLVLFEQFNGVLSSAEKTVVMLPDRIPVNGIGFLQNRKNCIFLKYKGSISTLYTSLGVACVTWINFYSQYLLPCSEEFTNEDMELHLKYLFWQVQNLGIDDLTVQPLMQILRRCRLFPSREGTKRLCSEMFCPNNQIFRRMLSNEKFPAVMYSDRSWLEFLKKLGLVDKLTEELFVRFAKILEEDVDIEKVLSVSKMLIQEHTNNQEFSYSLANRISDIRFLVPSDIQKDHEQLFKSRNSTVDRICFRDSCIHYLESVVWTNKYILPTYSTVGMQNDMFYGLGILRKDSNIDNSVLLNLKNILTDAPNNYHLRTRSYMEIKDEFRNVYFKVLGKFYNFVDDTKGESWISTIKDLSCIIVNEGSGLDIPRRAVQSSEITIYPYLNPSPVTIGKHFLTLQKMGCHKKVSISHLVDVLQEIQLISKGSVLDPNEEKNARKGVKSLSSLLEKNTAEDNAMADDEILYLPAVTFTNRKIVLKPSSECLFVDDCHMEIRLKEFDAPLLPDKYGKKLDPNNVINKNLMNYLPVDKKPKVLSESINELLTEEEDVQKVGTEHVSDDIQNRIKHPFFIENVKRLFRHENVTVDMVDQCLRDVKCFVKRKIRTHLLYKDEVIPGSDVDKKLFLRIDGGSLEIHFSPNSAAGNQLYGDIAEGLLKILGNKLKEGKSILTLQLLLSEDLNKLSEILDEKGISRDSSSSLYKTFGLPPLPGEPVPIELHDLLRSDFSSFKIGEFVAVEQTDSDGDERNYHYAIFKRRDHNPDIGKRLYGLQLTEGENLINDVPSYLVFKFERSFLRHIGDDDDGTSEKLPDFAADFKDKTFKQITKELHEIFKSLKNQDEKARKRILRRLYLAWHPDKHPEETKELATKVFQFIQNQLQKLKDGTIDCDSWDQQARRGWDRYNEYTRRYRDQNRGNFEPDNSSTFTPPTFEDFNPQPSEAKRWWRQAKHDINATDEVTQAHEWKCYMAHQAAEKALKAAKFKVHYERLNSHYLPVLVLSNGGYNDLYRWAQELQRITTRAEAMRYPDCWPAPSIPHTQYTSGEAERATILAKQIVDRVESIIR